MYYGCSIYGVPKASIENIRSKISRAWTHHDMMSNPTVAW